MCRPTTSARRHVGGIEVRARRFGPDPGDEGSVGAQPVPGPVVDLDVAARGLVALRQRERLLLVTVRLHPEDVVHGPGGFD